MHEIRPVPTAIAACSTQDQEPPLTIADAQQFVAARLDLPAMRRRDLASALSTVARMTGLPPASVTLAPEELRKRFPSWSAATYGVTLGTMRNILSGLRSVMRELDLIDQTDGPISDAWAAPLGRIDDERQRAGLNGLARFCTLLDVSPEQFDIEVLVAFERHLTTRTLTPRPRKQISGVRRGWNGACKSIPGWPGSPLPKLALPNPYIVPLSAFADSFQAALAALRGSMMANSLEASLDAETDDMPLSGSKPVRMITADLRQSHARWAASALVATGVPIDEITSLASLLTPIDRAQRVLRFLWRLANKQPSAAGGHVAEILLIIARHHLHLEQHDVALISKWSKPVRLSYEGLTEKNEAYVHRITSSLKRMEEFRALSAALMKAAQAMRHRDIGEASSTALRAVAIEILSKIPLRLSNLVGLQLDCHLRRDDPGRGLRGTYLADGISRRLRRRQTASRAKQRGYAREVLQRERGRRYNGTI